MPFGVDDAIMIGLGLASLLKGRKGPKHTILEKPSGPNQPNSALYNYLTTGMVPGSGGSSTGTSQSLTNYSGQTSPFVTPDYKNLEGLLRGTVESRLRSPTGLPSGFEATGVRGINSTYDASMQGLLNKLGSLGQLGSPAVGASAGAMTRGRAGDIAGFRANLPLLARELQNQDLGLAGNVLGEFGKGTSTSGTSATSGSTSGTYDVGPHFDPSGFFANENMLANSGGGMGGGFNSILQMLAMLYGMGKLGGGGTAAANPSGPIPGAGNY